MTLPDKEQFTFKDCTIAGDECWLITPNRMGVDWTSENEMFRSCIIRKTDNRIFSMGLKKFVNFFETPTFQPWDNSWKFDAYKKIDGCCADSTVLITEDGEKTIQEICDSKYFGKVLGYNHITGEEEMCPILEHSIKSNNNDWYELELEDGQILILTGNHKVYLPELGCYREVKFLKDEIFLIKR